MSEPRLFPALTRTEGWPLSRSDGGTSAPEDAQSCAAGWANLQATVLHAAPNLQSLMLPLLSPAAAAAAAAAAPPPPPPPPPPTAAVVAARSAGNPFFASACAAITFCVGCAYLHPRARHAAPNLHTFKLPAATIMRDPSPPATSCEACGSGGARTTHTFRAAAAAGASAAGCANGQPAPRVRQPAPNLHALGRRGWAGMV